MNNKKLVLLGFVGFISFWCLANHPPQARSQVLYVQPGAAVDILLLAEDPDGDPLQFEILDPPKNGKLFGAPPSLQYVANPDFEGKDRFSFLVCDQYGGFDLGTVEIIVSRAATTIKIVPNPPQGLVISSLVDFLVQQGVRTWYVINLGRPKTVTPGFVPFVFIGGDSPRFFLLSLRDDHKFSLSSVSYSSGFLDLRTVAPGEYLLLILAGNTAYSFSIIVAVPMPERKLIYDSGVDTQLALGSNLVPCSTALFGPPL